ncbi:MAG: aminomethyl-transferring glycine dehydrogenase subunit GcvPA [Myxococcales bacterium]|nr:aminomethyl-transferring glycine dehydrogenase subunit GcvPA [Myxococcota bacterium]MDW8280749.1 aminomethyl-transferring glycine dehydrogenase subunit GcvPA [Myxococcales bacterium]
MRYIPHTEEDVARMLRVVGVPSVEALFAHIPARLRLQRPLAIEPLDEAALLQHMEELAALSLPAISGPVRLGSAGAAAPQPVRSFLGAGLVPHYVPAAVDLLLLRAEWYTAYTPYQPEISQGTLQAIFEFQTIVAELFGEPVRPGAPAPFVANASLYDGASALAEAVLMARRLTGRPAALLAGAIHPQYAASVAGYLRGLSDGDPVLFQSGFAPDGRLDAAELAARLNELGETLACVVVQSPNYLGVVEDIRPVAQAARARGALLVAVCTEPLALGVLAPPGVLGADIVVGEGLGLAMPPSLGGPGVGLFAARSEYVRQMPGRLVGQTVDQAGRRGYCLTLSTREQHIRRDKATSNICTNQGLVALAFAIHLCLLGKQGFQALARLNLSLAQYARQRLGTLRGFSLAAPGPTFNELAVRVRGGRAAEVVDRLAERGLLAGVPLDRPGFALPALPGAEGVLLLAVSERHRREDIDLLAQALDEVCP